MADYGIFGHGSSGNGWVTSKLGDFHRWTKKWDPLGHYSVENPMKTAHWLVEKSSKGLADAGIGEGWNTRLNQEADENGDNFALGTTRMGVGVGSVLAAMYGYGALAGEGAGAGAGAGGGTAGVTGADGAFLGEGVASGVPAWDGAAGGMGLGFNPNGLPAGSSYASDIPTGGGGNSGLGGFMRGIGGNANQGQQSADTRALQQQQEMARLMREAEQRRRNEESAELPGWVNMEQGVTYG